MLFVVTSDFRKDYKNNVKKALSLPEGIEQYFTYDEKYVDEEIINNPDKYTGQEALLLYKRKVNDYEQIVAVKKMIVKKIEKIEDLVNIFFIQTNNFWIPPSNPVEQSQIISDLLDIFRSHSKKRLNKFVFEDEIPPNLKFGNRVKPLFEAFIEDYSLAIFSPLTIETLYTVEFFDQNDNPLERKDGMLFFQPCVENRENIIKVRIMFHSKKVNSRRGSYSKTFYISANRIIFPVEHFETDRRDGIIYAKGIAKPGFDVIKIDVDSGYSVEVPILIEEKNINECKKNSGGEQ